ncbi:protein BPS1, chloroplastic-like [Mangifera indica]|uniref:protein BPS1, chloroplastic-like n=1 Tax=Mangifera indica TaxID=29780 RepID=UPI001CF96E2A|nr:protein BPS1, chloroplastic-like [Mangifera indica]
MVLLVQRLSKVYFKLENHLHHHRHEPEALQASLQDFESHISICLTQLSKPGSEFLSLSWILQCFEILPSVNKAFAKLVVDIDYPMCKWEENSVEEYLEFSLTLLELLNSISSSVSHLGHARLCLSHAVDLVESSPSSAIERLKAVQVKGSSSIKDGFRKTQNKEDGDERLNFSSKEKILHLALLEVKRVGLWICGVILAGLSGDSKPYLETIKELGGLSGSTLSGLDSSFCEAIKQGVVLKEVRELNDSAACFAAAIEAGNSSHGVEELKRKLQAFEKLIDSLTKEVDLLFSMLLAGRNELLNGIRKVLN